MVKMFRVKYGTVMLINLGGEIDNRTAENPTFDPKPDLLTNHMTFRKRNSGRLVSKFLKSFM
jgi:hypothetical protein